MKKLLIFSILLVFIVLSCKKDSEEPLYFPKVKSIILANCTVCHTLGGQGMPVILESDEDITSRATSIKETTIDPVSPQNKRMPQTGELTQADKDIILKWFEKGGKSTD